MSIPINKLVQFFAEDFFSLHDVSICKKIMVSNYELTIGRHVISGRDENYIPAVLQQFDQFPNIAMTVHTLMSTNTRAAIHFTEFGTSTGTTNAYAAWSGIAIFESNGEQLVRCHAQEDYFSRRQQLKTGTPVSIIAPSHRPWSQPCGEANPLIEKTVREWLEKTYFDTENVSFDDQGLDSTISFTSDSVEILTMFSAGNKVAFHVAHTGRYRRGFVGKHASTNQVELISAGIVQVEDGKVKNGHVVRDRLSMLRNLSN